MKKIIIILLTMVICLGLFCFISCKSENAPYIGKNGNWWIGNTDLNVSAQGEKGEKGDKGETGKQGENGINGVNGKDGIDGTSVTITDCKKTKSVNNVDTYEISFSDGKKCSFTVTNGKNGQSVTVKSVKKISSVSNVDTYQITFSDGFETKFTLKNGKDGIDGKDGLNLSILNIEKVKSEGVVDTYEITYSDKSKLEFTVVNGQTPIIGENGNWWINGADTGVFAGQKPREEYEYTDEEKIASQGLEYSSMTINGKSGYVVSGYNVETAKTSAYSMYDKYMQKYTISEFQTYVNEILNNRKIVIPDYIGETPVIGVTDDVFASNYYESVRLSKNTMYLGERVFANATKLKTVDFNDCKIAYLSERCFYNSGLKKIELPETVNVLFDYALYGCKLDNFDYSNVKYFGNYCVQDITDDYVFISKDVKYVGTSALPASVVYVEEGADHSKWEDLTKISLQNAYNTQPVVNCKRNESFIYAVTGDSSVTAYRYFVDSEVVVMPSQIENKNVTRLGQGFLTQINELKAHSELIGTQKLVKIKTLVLPNTVECIDKGALDLYGAVIYIPSSVTKMYKYTCTFDNTSSSTTSYIAFESSSLPTFFGNTEADIVTQESWLSTVGDYFRYSTSIDWTKVKYATAKKTAYYEDEDSVALLAYMNFDANKAIIDDLYNEKPITLIKSTAFSSLLNLDVVIVGKNVNRIQKYAFNELSLKYASIPKNVQVINKYGFNNCCDKYFIEATVLPDDWDSLWAGNNNPDVEYGRLISDYVVEKNGFSYYVVDNEITLLSHPFKGDYIYIPRTIDGKNVTRIAKFFEKESGGKNIYIPKTVTNIEQSAFYKTSSSNTYFYIEASKIPEGWQNGYCKSGYYSGYYYEYLEQTMPVFNFNNKLVYFENPLDVTLVNYYGEDKNIYLPRKINGKIVTTIKKDFIRSAEGKKVYIPKTITSIASQAFIGTEANTWYFYFEASSGENGFWYNSQSSSKTYSANYYNQQLIY